VTEDDGSFALDGLQPGASYRIEIDRDGWIGRSQTITTRVDGESSRLAGDLQAHDPPDLYVEVVDCLTGSPLDSATVAVLDTTVTTDARGVASAVDLPHGSVTVEVTRRGYVASSATAWLPSTPPFRREAAVVLCPVPEGTSLVWVGTTDGLLAVAPSRVTDDHAGQPYFGADELAANSAWYLVDPETPVLPRDELRAASSTGRARRVLLGRLPTRNRDRGWLAGRVIEVGEDGVVPGPFKTDGLYGAVPRGALRAGGYIGLGSFAWFEPSDDAHIWTRLIVAGSIQPEGIEQPDGFDLVELPEDGLWALIPATATPPWPIYVVHAGGEG